MMKSLKLCAVVTLVCCASQVQAERYPIVSGAGRFGLSTLGLVVGAAGGAALGNEISNNKEGMLVGCGVGGVLCALLVYASLSDCTPEARKALLKKLVRSLRHNELLRAPDDDDADYEGFGRAFVEHVRSVNSRSTWPMALGHLNLTGLSDDKNDAEDLAKRLDEYFPGIVKKNKRKLERVESKVQRRLRVLFEAPGYHDEVNAKVRDDRKQEEIRAKKEKARAESWDRWKKQNQVDRDRRERRRQHDEQMDMEREKLHLKRQQLKEKKKRNQPPVNPEWDGDNYGGRRPPRF
ncbi:hypothetical protein HOD08_00875 [bacterium]|nr:hypothetical protein [bacterium]